MDQPHHMYEGYLFFKADPLPGHQPTWWRVERSWMCFTQVDLYTMIHQRAFQISAANQYQALSTERRLQLDQLIHERRQQDAFAEWSCAYAEEHTRVTSGQDSISHGLETIAMTAILMRRPRATKIHPRTPMGDLVDLSRLRPSIMGVTTASGLSAGRTHSHSLAVSKTHRDPIPSSTQGRASRTCLEHALFGRQSKTMNGSALPERWSGEYWLNIPSQGPVHSRDGEFFAQLTI
ncbi:uncharacterized protein N7469_002202 [Penicillium citrinum]|uniref:Uncharacterized protein n=1 Tax=Penicillium citrinum TaxID=5077 RepID=A0A9W9PAT5_PENCI|nr:uncharacterized protein N7469_002202 [Penicillium citrinum]KAJ5240611.1 hypothetical protein N7469_002202 [Penicillium citrinum]